MKVNIYLEIDTENNVTITLIKPFQPIPPDRKRYQIIVDVPEIEPRITERIFPDKVKVNEL